MSTRKRRDLNLLGKTNIEVYDMVRRGDLKIFPAGFWDKNTAKELIRYVYKDYSKEQLLNIRFRKDLVDKKISMAYQLFNLSPFEMLSYCFPELKIKVWELRVVPDGCWDNKDNVKEAVRNAFRKERVRSKKRICKILSADFLRKHGLKGIMKKYTLYEIIQIAFPEYVFIESDLNKQYNWTEEKIVKNIRYMIEEVLKWNYTDICNKISTETFVENGLGGLLAKTCHNSVYEALELAYPGKFQKKDLRSYNVKFNFGRYETPIS